LLPPIFVMDVSAWTVRPLHESFTIYAHPQLGRKVIRVVMFTICYYLQHATKMEYSFRRFTVYKISFHKHKLIYRLIQGKYFLS